MMVHTYHFIWPINRCAMTVLNSSEQRHNTVLKKKVKAGPKLKCHRSICNNFWPRSKCCKNLKCGCLILGHSTTAISQFLFAIFGSYVLNHCHIYPRFIWNLSTRQECISVLGRFIFCPNLLSSDMVQITKNGI